MKKQASPTSRQYLGRQPLPAAERLGKSIPVRLTEDMRAAAIEDADRRGIRLGVWVREAIAEKLARERK